MNVASLVLLLSSVISPQSGTAARLPKGDQRLDAPVTYETKARLTSAILDDLSKSTKVSLSVDEQLEGEPLIVRLHDVPLRDAMDKIAHSLYGSWRQKDQSYFLSRPPEVQEQLEQTAIDEQTKKIDAALKKALESRPTKPIIYEDVKRYSEITTYVNDQPLAKVSAKEEEDARNSDCYARLQASVFSMLDPRAIASARYPEHTIFSDQPRPLEHKLAATSDQVHALYDEQNEWTTNIRKLAHNDKRFDWFGGDRHLIKPDDARLVITVSWNSSNLIARIHIVNGNGKEYFYESDAVASNDDPEVDVNKTRDKKEFEKLGFHPSPISQEAMEIRGMLLTSDSDPKESRPINPAMRNLVLDPVSHDPLSFAPSETLLAMGDEKDWNVIARLADDCVQKTGAVTGSMTDPASFLAARALDCEVVAKDGWITIRPQHALDEELSRANRPALADFMNSIDQLGYPSIDAEASYLAQHIRDGGDTLGYWWPLLLQYRGDPFEDQNKNALRLYGLLSASQRSLLLSGGTIGIDQLSKEQLEASKDWIMDWQMPGVDDSNESYAATAGSTTIDVSNSEKDPDMKELIYWTTFDDLLDSITDLFSDGSRLSMHKLDGLSVREKLPSGYEIWTTPQQIALSKNNYGREDNSTYSIGKKHGILMHLDLSANAHIHTELTDHYGAMSAWAPYGSLPADLRKIIEDLAKKNNPNTFEIAPAQTPGSGGDDGRGSTPPLRR